MGKSSFGEVEWLLKTRTSKKRPGLLRSSLASSGCGQDAPQSGQQPRGEQSQFSCGCDHIPEKEWHEEGFVVWGGVQSAAARETLVADVSGCLL